jgi:hypothetical protein
MNAHTTAADAARCACPALGLPIPRPARPAVAWGAWVVVDREHGFHVSREGRRAIAGSAAAEVHGQTLLNEVGKTKIFRRRELAQAACDRANAVAGQAHEQATGQVSP